MKRFVYINDESYQNDYCDNQISNTKYTLWNFLPKNLWEQFRRFMNQYFLLIACLQLWSLITPVNPASTWGPLIIIFAVSATKEAWDDYNRYISDKQANEKKVWIVKNGARKHIQAQDIRVGNIVWIRENEEVPCDLVLTGTSEPQGICHVETAALDGEIDLKTRVIPPTCAGLDAEQLHKIKGVIECPIPDKDIRRFDANIRLFPPFIDNDICPLTINNTLLQSCYLRNTEWACGVAVYTGNETKLGMSRGVPEPKLTAMDAMIDKLTGAIFLFQLAVVVVLGSAGNVWKDTEARKQWYVKYDDDEPWYQILVIPLRFELLCSIMIPISIKVSLDFVKSLYAKFIDWDEEMYDKETDTPAHAANTAISEDLGQVEYILTDKTGTLTENKMIFRRCCIGGTLYGNESGDALKDVELLNAVANNSPHVIKFLTVMALCNTVIPIKSPSGQISYKAQSQDEDALVNAASNLHMVLVSKNGNNAEIHFNRRVVQYEILDVLEFTSDRKRMSVLISDSESGKIFLLSKGADEAILPLAYSGQQIKTFIDAVDKYAQLGLRTLCLAWRELGLQEYLEWSRLFKEANSALIDREWKVAEVCQKLEHTLDILGISAIEDRLQAGVPETIEILRQSGINFWMLTGDKQSTAIQIALLCNLISSEPKGQLLYINGKTEDEVARSLERVLLTMRITSSEPKEQELAFVVDGWALEIILTRYKEAFTELAVLSKTAICCRVTPSQKAQLVKLLKSCDYRTLAIGDGGNDVRMIQQAHIGVGISGREGLQAARAADYSIGKFRFLKRLILVHGRYSYNRTAFLSQYSFYKSLLICFIQILFSFVSGIAGTSLFNSVSLMAYNVFYTSIPVLTTVLDKDLSERTVTQNPEILLYCQAGRLLNPSTFAGWFGRSLYHAIVVFLITIHVYANEKSEMEELSMVALSGSIWLQAFVVTLEMNSFTFVQFLGIWGNFAAFYIINFGISSIPSAGMYTIMFRLCRQPSYWITMLLISGVGMGPVLALKYFRYTYSPSAINILQKAERSRGPMYTLVNLESQLRLDNNATDSISSMPVKKSSVYEPLLSDSPMASRRSVASSSFDIFQPAQSRVPASYPRNIKAS
ncbi:phospholipid-transporting ATPase 2 isoform X1 [Brachypodium distachyon]|uniref:phospholipid-transporting ATPase 2 isoform X1 n=1 Tax=Brachypodium distachyon TaxID=15368 RepID=UPI00052FDC62|nr:phospholipid-transporting ATPase 2 isoform X1 [Brachypodium distachyon]XP_014752882.1 phospholipid-transporting ATPase 2 isoform X1 [Brachypodium distachyon]|eukprot:XP_010236944.1 phospholipid-transporting ATPase 2 isoform X1 [Brachypodium distachyon]